MDSHYDETLIIQQPINVVTQNLVENLHLRWGYGLMYVDRYMDEHDEPVNVVYGLRLAPKEATYGIRVSLSKDNKATVGEVDIWRVESSGWPFKDIKKLPRLSPTSQRVIEQISDDIVKFCEKPHGQGGSMMDALRSFFGGGSEKRKYKR